MTLTERRQRCNGESKLRTTKLCVTYSDGTGSCKDLTRPGVDVCEEEGQVKIINAEVELEERLECSTMNKGEIILWRGSVLKFIFLREFKPFLGANFLETEA